MINLLRGVILRFFYPLLMLLAAFLKDKRDRFQSLIIDLNNRLVRRAWSSKSHPGSQKVLLLLPHCLQVTECDVRITYNIMNCKRCGRCSIKDLIDLAEKDKLDIFVATGGTIARRIVGDVRPDAIVAVACERDLSSGIVDTYPLPVLGVTNSRPFGPCLNTKVDLSRVREALQFFSGT
jgi:uncharacterized protein